MAEILCVVHSKPNFPPVCTTFAYYRQQQLIITYAHTSSIVVVIGHTLLFYLFALYLFYCAYNTSVLLVVIIIIIHTLLPLLIRKNYYVEVCFNRDTTADATLVVDISISGFSNFLANCSSSSRFKAIIKEIILAGAQYLFQY